jgi:hypothetical protein
MPQYPAAIHYPENCDRSTLQKKTLGAIAIKSLALLVALGAAYQATAQDATTAYPSMAAIEQYLMDRTAEIALARAAAPESISRDAEVLVLGPHGFERAIKGKNGFVCIVARSWTSAPDSDFWNPKVRVPMCLNAIAARSYLLRITDMTDLILAGRTKAQMTATVAAAVAKKQLSPMGSGAMCYMMSKQGYASDSAEHWPPHLMFFYSQTNPATWGAGLPGSPILASTDASQQLTSFVVVVQQWSDGTEYIPAAAGAAERPASPPHVHP